MRTIILFVAFGTTLLAALVVMRVTGGPLARTTSRPAADPVVPSGHSIEPQTLDVSQDGRWVAYVSREERGDRSPLVFHLLDSRKGKEIDLSTIAPDASSGQFSPDGKNLLVLCRSKGGMLLRSLALKTLKATDLCRGGHLSAVWVGSSIAVTEVTSDREFKHLKVVSPDGGKTEETPICGAAIAADQQGRVRVVAAWAADPTKAVTVEDKSKLSFLAMDAKWRKLAVLGTIGRVGSMVWISPSGKYVAYQRRPAGKGMHYTVAVQSTDGKEEREIDAFALPLAITDSGGVLATKATFTPGSTLWFCEKGNTKPTELSEHVRDAALVGSRIYYVHSVVTDRIKSTLKMMDLPESK